MNDSTTLEPDASVTGDDHGIASTTIETSIDIAASPERVFSALTDPEELAAWWGSDDTYRTRDWRMDPRPGGEWSARTVDPSGQEGSIHGRFAIVDRPGVLESTWRASWDDGPATTIRYDLSPAIVHDAPGTRLTVTHTGFSGITACAAMDLSHLSTLDSMLQLLMQSTRVRRRAHVCAV